MMRKKLGFILVFLIFLMAVFPENVQTQEEAKPAKSTAEETKQETEPLLLEQEQQDTGEGPVVSYLIEAELFPIIRKLSAKETLIWRNTSSHAVDHLRFHLYYNAFRDLNSTFMQEAKYYKKSKGKQRKLKFGEIKIEEIQRLGGVDLTENQRFVSPDDNNPDDGTVMELKLDKAVQPGQTIRLKIDFALTIPEIFLRTGAEGNYFFMAQWFPKIGVMQKNGQWHCHQFHHNSEFFADYGDYRVALTVPEKFVVGATGNLVKKKKNADKTLTYWYQEKNIHDFAWTAYPHFKKITEKIRLKGNKEDTTIELLLSPAHSAVKERYLNTLKYTMSFFAQHIFPYPYKKITLVDPPLKGRNSCVMEYPTLITGCYIDLLPGSIKFPETITVHEFAHQYWYGIVGTDEAREPWLDEGVTTFFEMEILEGYFQDSASLLTSSFFPVNQWEALRVFYTWLLPVDPVHQYSWKFLNFLQYAGNVYTKTAIFLKSLKNLVGKEQMYNFFRYYAEKYKFKHPTTEDFIDTFNTFMNDDFSWAFDWFIRGEGGLDHAVHSLESMKITSNPDKYRNEAVFVRKEGYFPVELLITLDNGKEIKSFWKKKEKWQKIVFDDTSPIKTAVIDPLFQVPLDQNFLNNSKTRESNTSGIKRLALKIGFFFQNILGALIL
jgi:hypothetical protein